MMVTTNDFRRQWEDIGEDALAAVDRVGSSGWYILGQEVAKFEAELANHWGADHAVGVANGTDAIEIALKALGCKWGDRVLTTPLSAFATTLAILKLGAIPVFVDTDDRGLIDLNRCRELLNERPDIKYFVPVHLYGHVLDLGGLRMLRDEFGLLIVEDCAQAAGARMRGETPGSAGHMATTSFYPTKNLGAMGDGGAVLTNDAELALRSRVLRNYGETEKYNHQEIGFNSRLDEVQAAILRDASLPRLKRWVGRRRAVAEAYQGRMRNPDVILPGTPPGSKSSWHLFPVHVDPAHRAAFLEHLKAQGVAGGVHYPTAIPDQPALRQANFEVIGDLTNARRICTAEVSLPIHPYMTDEEVTLVIDAVNCWVAEPEEPVEISDEDGALAHAAQANATSNVGATALRTASQSMQALQALSQAAHRWSQPLKLGNL